MPQPSVTEISYLEFYSNLPGANELNTLRVLWDFHPYIPDSERPSLC